MGEQLIRTIWQKASPSADHCLLVPQDDVRRASMAELEQLIEQCSAEEREQILAAAYYVAFADGRFWREKPLLDRIRWELDVPEKTARRLQGQAASPRAELTVPERQAARQLAYHYALAVAASDGRLDKRERETAEMLGSRLGLSKEEVAAGLDASVPAETPKPRRKCGARSNLDRLAV